MQCAVCSANIDRVGSAAQLPELILILILNFMPQLRVWLDFLAGNQTAAAAVAALAALAGALLPSKLKQFDTLETCILAASLATHSLRRRQHFVASCLSHSESGDSPQVPPGRAQLQLQLQLQFPQFPSSSSSFHNHNLPRCAAISEQTRARQVSGQLRSCTCHTPDLQAPIVT